MVFPLVFGLSTALFAQQIPPPAKTPADIKVCSFNIQFLGTFSSRDNEGLAKMIASEACDVLVVQELVAPPSETYLALNHLYTFPMFPQSPLAQEPQSPLASVTRMFPPKSKPAAAGVTAGVPELLPPEPIHPSDKATAFFDAMKNSGYSDFILSEEDTGATAYHTNGSASEWFVTFFRPEKLEPAADLPHGFLSETRVANKSFERTPYAFPFRTRDGKLDFVLISVHLAPNGPAWKRRQQELAGIRAWVDANRAKERDFIVLGDMNIENQAELQRILPRQADPAAQGGSVPVWDSLNAACVATNTNVRAPKPYDQVLFDPRSTTELELPRGEANFHVIPLAERMRSRWAEVHPGTPYPGGEPPKVPYLHDRFRTEYSDHNPVFFRMTIPEADDDESSASSS